MLAPTTRDTPLIMLVGMGDLSSRLLSMLLSHPRTNRVVIAGRDPDALRLRANLARFAAANIGLFGTVDVERVDLHDISSTAEVLARVRPDIVFMGSSLQSWRVITQLPKDVFEELDQAQLGPWLPRHLALNHLLMRAVRMSGTETRVVNAAYPDVVGPVLARVGLAPDLGIGNVANIVPALTLGFAHHAHAHPTDVEVKLVAQHYFSHYVPRFGDAGSGAYHLTARVGGELLDTPHQQVFQDLTGPLKRLGGIDGQLLTASSAMRVLTAMATDSGTLCHAPAPAGLPGGYPVRVGRKGASVDLDPGLPLDEAVRINEDCQRADGIEGIDEDGTVTFTGPEMAIMKRMINYECRSMKLDEAGEWADELGQKWEAFAARHAVPS